VFTECGQYTDSNIANSFMALPTMLAKDNCSIWICTLYFSSVTIHVRAIKFRVWN
jgi:hypothetical protein